MLYDEEGNLVNFNKDEYLDIDDYEQYEYYDSETTSDEFGRSEYDW